MNQFRCKQLWSLLVLGFRALVSRFFTATVEKVNSLQPEAIVQ